MVSLLEFVLSELSLTTASGDLLRYRQLLLSLTWRDIRIRYKQSALGIGWAILLPLSMMLIFTFVFTRAIDASKVMDVAMPYALYAYLGLVPWTFFSQALGSAVNSLVANRNLVTKVYFPREVFPLACIGSSFVDFCVATSVLVVLIGYYHVRGIYAFTPHATLLFLPIVMLVQVTMMIGIGLILSMANLFYRDVRQLFTVTIQLLMFVSGVVVPLPQDGSLLARVVGLNPIVPVIGAYRDCVIHGRLPEVGGFVYACVFAAFVLLFGWICFRKAAYRFAECI